MVLWGVVDVFDFCVCCDDVICGLVLVFVLVCQQYVFVYVVYCVELFGIGDVEGVICFDLVFGFQVDDFQVDVVVVWRVFCCDQYFCCDDFVFVVEGDCYVVIVLLYGCCVC